MWLVAPLLLRMMCAHASTLLRLVGGLRPVSPGLTARVITVML